LQKRLQGFYKARRPKKPYLRNMQQGNFERLKAALETRFRESHPYCPPISDWKGQEIVLFQEDLGHHVEGRVSEKWFYTHIKSGPREKLPRIDVLNMLSRYVGFENWDHFCAGNEQGANKVADLLEQKTVSAQPEKTFAWQWLLLIGILMLGMLAFVWPAKKQMICFIDGDGGPVLYPDLLEVALLTEGETPLRLEVDSAACVVLPGKFSKFSLVVDGAYYHRDTVFRSAREAHFEKISLRKDDYALMIHYFSTARITDWQKRREQLDEMIDERARIFQVWEDGKLGMEMFNKQEFINKLTTPVSSLKNIEILETTYRNEKIVGLRFVQKNHQNEAWLSILGFGDGCLDGAVTGPECTSGSLGNGTA
jgi:hypothetical protein